MQLTRTQNLVGIVEVVGIISVVFGVPTYAVLYAFYTVWKPLFQHYLGL